MLHGLLAVILLSSKIFVTSNDEFSGNFTTSSPLTNLPCSPLRPGDSDFQTLDLIALFRLDRPDTTGVTLVQGTQDLQRAYRIGGGANLTLPLRKVFPLGMPRDFSIVSTFNARGLRKPWSLVLATTASRSLAFSVSFLPVSKQVVVFVRGWRAVFECPELFTHRWHKVHLAVQNTTANLAVDCGELYPESVVRYSYDNFHNITSISILTRENGIPAPVDIQWLSISCTQYNLTEESCEELERAESIAVTSSPPLLVGVESISSEHEIFNHSCNGTCPQGPIGPQGLKGEPGIRGPTGLPGIRGPEGPRGLVGPQGLKGDKGEPGSDNDISNEVVGEKGQKGEQGEKGDHGYAGIPGSRGRDGNDGHPGAPGPVGPPGERGIPGPPGSHANINGSLLQGPPGERGYPGLPGRNGNPGSNGLPGAEGPRGFPGNDGSPGFPGQSGPPGPTGPAGERGPEGPQGPEGQPGPPGPQGPPGNIVTDSVTPVIGPPGPKGDKGQTGDSGLPGALGPPGRPGSDGIPGAPGQRGPPGIPAPVSQSLVQPTFTENDVRNICEEIVRVRLQELSATIGSQSSNNVVHRGLPGKPGPPGPPGTPGIQGDQGERGYPGFSGQPGIPGTAGPAGAKGEKGERGPEGIGLPGADGLRGLQGPVGPPGVEGRPGARGDPGREGPMGPRGVQGPRGTCDCPSAAFYAYAAGNTKGP